MREIVRVQLSRRGRVLGFYCALLVYPLARRRPQSELGERLFVAFVVLAG